MDEFRKIGSMLSPCCVKTLHPGRRWMWQRGENRRDPCFTILSGHDGYKRPFNIVRWLKLPALPPVFCIIMSIIDIWNCCTVNWTNVQHDCRLWWRRRPRDSACMLLLRRCKRMFSTGQWKDTSVETNHPATSLCEDDDKDKAFFAYVVVLKPDQALIKIWWSFDRPWQLQPNANGVVSRWRQETKEVATTSLSHGWCDVHCFSLPYDGTTHVDLLQPCLLPKISMFDAYSLQYVGIWKLRPGPAVTRC